MAPRGTGLCRLTTFCSSGDEKQTTQKCCGWRKLRIRNPYLREIYSFNSGGTMAAQPMQDQTPNPNEKLVKVFESESESEAMVVKGLLDSAGIDSDLMSGSLVQETFPGLGGVVILVREEDAGQSRQVIAESREAIASGESSDADDDATEELPAAE
jgi:hypothetical protein